MNLIRPIMSLWVSLLATLISGEAGAVLVSQDQYPQQQRESTSRSVFSREGFHLELAWKKPLGSGHSGIAVVDGRVITMFSDGQFDNLVMLKVETGEEIWRKRIAPTYRGHGGSEDGPHSTPAVDQGVVYALGPKGQLLAVKLIDGQEVWSRKIDQEFDAKAPI